MLCMTYVYVLLFLIFSHTFFNRGCCRLLHSNLCWFCNPMCVVVFQHLPSLVSSTGLWWTLPSLHCSALAKSQMIPHSDIISSRWCHTYRLIKRSVTMPTPCTIQNSFQTSKHFRCQLLPGYWFSLLYLSTMLSISTRYANIESTNLLICWFGNIWDLELHMTYP